MVMNTACSLQMFYLCLKTEELKLGCIRRKFKRHRSTRHMGGMSFQVNYHMRIFTVAVDQNVQVMRFQDVRSTSFCSDKLHTNKHYGTFALK